MMKHLRIAVLLALAASMPLAAGADTLYQSAPPPAGPGHPLRLTADHRATQVGDLLYIQFDFNDANSHTNNYSSTHQAGFTLSGLFNIPAINGASAANANRSESGADSFISTMMATVTDVLPSGVLAIAGDQGVVVNGRRQILHITGFVRPEDLDFTDAVVSSRVANVQATFNGDDQKHKGLIQQILNYLF
jgi:flagellar L-ring protein FlgH